MPAKIPVNTLRFLAVDAVEKAKSGHPGMPMGAAPMAFTLWTKFLKFDPKATDWADRDRFVLSAGHGSMLLYGLLHLAGIDVSLEDIKNFRQWGSKTPGHPEYGHTPGVETTTGPLGQGIGAAVGMAIAERHLAARFNRPGFEIVNHYTYAIAGDGCLMEGISSEAASLAGHLGLGKLILLYDDNKITIDGPTSLTFTEDVTGRFTAYGWQVLFVNDGNDVDEIEKAIADARADLSRPSLIRVNTIIGFGCPKKQGTSGVHGSPLGAEETKAAKEFLCWEPHEPFTIPEDAYAPFRKMAGKGKSARRKWKALFAEYESAFPALAEEFKRRDKGELPGNWEKALPVFPADAKGIASRVASGKVLNALARALPEIMGGSADLTPSNNTYIENDGDFTRQDHTGRNIRFGVREHAMGAVANGMANYGMFIPYTATFFVFTDYMRPSIRLSALMGLNVVHVMTHDSIFLGEDGPTHQPVEHLASLRAMPNLSVIRPADANETAMGWKAALTQKNRPTVLVLSRQNLPTLDREKYGKAEGVLKGGYILKEAKGGVPKAIIIASGSDVHLALSAAEKLETENIPVRVVNMASWDLFEAQTKKYRSEVLPPAIKARVAIESASTFGWERYTGFRGKVIGIDRFGASAPAEVLAEKYGMTVENVISAVKKLV
ncbi:transketolase [bacterium]|nr:MAG: transketolase [bacterium]